MGLFSAFVKTVVETAKMPINVVKDCATLGNAVGNGNSYVATGIKRIKQASEDKSESEMSQQDNIIP